MLYGELQNRRRSLKETGAKAVPGQQAKLIGINPNTKDTQDDMDILERVLSDNLRTIGDSLRATGLVKALRNAKIRFGAADIANFIANGGLRKTEMIDRCADMNALALAVGTDKAGAEAYITDLQRNGNIFGFANRRAFVYLPLAVWKDLSTK